MHFWWWICSCLTSAAARTFTFPCVGSLILLLNIKLSYSYSLLRLDQLWTNSEQEEECCINFTIVFNRKIKTALIKDRKIVFCVRNGSQERHWPSFKQRRAAMIRVYMFVGLLFCLFGTTSSLSRASPLDVARGFDGLSHAPSGPIRGQYRPQERPVAMQRPGLCRVLSGSKGEWLQQAIHSSLYLMLCLTRSSFTSGDVMQMWLPAYFQVVHQPSEVKSVVFLRKVWTW